MRRGALVWTGWSIACALACAPKLSPPRESTQIRGTVAPPAGEPAAGAPKAPPLPIQVMVYERCSPQLYFFRKCPGRSLGQAKIAKPGPFVVEIDTESPEVTIYAFRGFLGQEQACAVRTLPTAEAARAIELKLENEPCADLKPEGGVSGY